MKCRHLNYFGISSIEIDILMLFAHVSMYFPFTFSFSESKNIKLNKIVQK